MLKLPAYNNMIERYRLTGVPLAPSAPKNKLTRTAFAAAHVVSDPLRDRDPWDARPAIDWEMTLRFRINLWDQGLGLAEAMDTAQRGMGVDWLTAKELIERTMVEARSHPLTPRVACGAGTDHVSLDQISTEADIIAAYSLQMEAIEKAGGQIIIMASRAFAHINARADSYQRVYEYLLEQANEPVILHWLGDMFDPALAGYWGHVDVNDASNFVHGLIRGNASKVDGIKISLLDEAHEVEFRKNLVAGVRLYTGDDFNYAPLIEGDGKHFSHALLGIFAAIAPAASQALDALAEGNNKVFNKLLAPTVPLSREIFKSPTRFYKAGIAYLAWLNGHQNNFILPAGFQSSREITHYAEVFRLADKARLLENPEMAEKRMASLLSVHGIEQD